MSSENRSDGETREVRLPEGAEILTREPVVEEIEVAVELAERGASDALVRAVGGDEAVSRARRRAR